MTTFVNNDVSSGAVIYAADHNEQGSRLSAVINGGIDNNNIASGAAIDGSKLANNSLDLGDTALPWDGWVGITDSWAYASATTITVPAGAADRFSVGDKIRFSQSGTKYFYVTTVADTLLTVTGGSDYTVANAAISSIAYSKVATPQGFPAAFLYTATPTGFSANPTSVARFSLNGKLCTVTYVSTAGGTSNATTYTIAAPINADTTNLSYGFALVRDNGTFGDGVINTQSGDATAFQVRKTGLTAFTNSGTKDTNFVFTYRIA